MITTPPTDSPERKYGGEKDAARRRQNILYRGRPANWGMAETGMLRHSPGKRNVKRRPPRVTLMTENRI